MMENQLVGLLVAKTIKKINNMATITINIEDVNDAADACREVADKIDEGYTSGLIGFSSDSWELNED